MRPRVVQPYGPAARGNVPPEAVLQREPTDAEFIKALATLAVIFAPSVLAFMVAGIYLALVVAFLTWGVVLVIRAVRGAFYNSMLNPDFWDRRLPPRR